MSLPELFHHAHRFVGALGVRRLRFSPDPDAGQHALAQRLLYPAANSAGWIALAPLAIESPLRPACPAREEDGRCAIHHDRKPLACSVVPLDALLSDARQHAVLAARSRGGAEYLGADCILPTQQAHGDFQPHVDSGRIINGEARRVLTAQRAALAEDKHWWGNSVFAQLRTAGLEPQLPAHGLLSLPLAPVLQAVAGLSADCHAACLRYAETQQALIADHIAAALLRKSPEERAFTTHLRTLADTYSHLLRSLRHTPAGRHAPAATAWLLAGSPLHA